MLLGSADESRLCTDKAGGSEATRLLVAAIDAEVAGGTENVATSLATCWGGESAGGRELVPWMTGAAPPVWVTVGWPACEKITAGCTQS